MITVAFNKVEFEQQVNILNKKFRNTVLYITTVAP